MSKQEVRLERRLSPVNVWSLALGCMIGWGAFVMPGNTFLAKAGPLGTAIAMAAAAAGMIIIACNYSFMINRYQTAGGEFTYAQMAFGRRHAFVCSWFLSLSYLAIVPLNGTALALIGRSLFGHFFQFGFHYQVAGYDIYLGEILLAEAALVGFAALSIRGVKFAGVFQTGLMAALVGGVLMLAAAALVSPCARLENLAPAYAPGASPVGGILAVVAVAPWAFVGFDTIPQAAEEFNFSARKTRAIMILSILFGAAIYVSLNTITAMTVPDGYATWAEYIEDLPNLTGTAALPTFYAAKLLMGSLGLVFVGIAVLAAILSGIIGFYMAASRLLYSMSQEGVLPGWFGKLHPEYRTPKHAILFVMGISLTAPFFGRTALNWIVDMSSIGAAIGYAYTSAAAMKFARREGNRGIWITGALGLILGAAFCALLLVPIPTLSCSLGRESELCLAVWAALGLIFYRASRKPRLEMAKHI